MNLQKIYANDVELHYIEQGAGIPVVLVHGGLADYREWRSQIARFARIYRVIAYSRRYNYPNQNPEIGSNHSAIVEAEDLAALIQALGLDRPHIVGHSYGAFAALLLGLKYPYLVRALVLAEPPVHRWARQTPEGEQIFSDFMQSFWNPVRQAFQEGNPELALEITAQTFIGRAGLTRLSDRARQIWWDNIREWEALAASHDAYPAIPPEQVVQMRLPTLLLTGGRTIPIHRLVNDVLESLITVGYRQLIQEATHAMWATQPEACGEATLTFLTPFEFS
jgi:pimeloyl-ACP methyl ester carboxylesterase